MGATRFSNNKSKLSGSHRMKSIHELLSKLNRVMEVKPRQYIAICPRHNDMEPSLSIKQADEKILLKCFAGYTTFQ